MSRLTTAQVLALAPDDASAKAGRGLTKPAKWVMLGASDDGLWGECQGSGAKPYQVMVDFNGMSSKCSCPSRKFPCKHGLALMLMHAEGTGTFASSPPQWMTEWIGGRRDRAEKQTAKKEATASAPPPDPAKAAKRQEARLDRMRSGAAWLSLWMRDLVREGLADLLSRPSSFWKETAARMVDAQAPGLGRRVQEMETLLYTGTDWPSLVLAAMGRAQLLIDALERFDALPAELQADVRTALGWAQEKEAALTSAAKEDTWTVRGVVFEESGALCERRVWLTGASGATAQLLDFSHGGRRFENAWAPGMQVKGAAAFFPSAVPQRVLLTIAENLPAAAGRMERAGTFADALEHISDSLAANPWLLRHPVALRQARLMPAGGGWLLADEGGAQTPVRIAETPAWRLTAITGGRPADLFGEWTAERFHPLSACTTRGWMDLTA